MVAEFDLVVIGASAGGLAPLRRLLGELPLDLPVAFFVVMHVPPSAPSRLPEILMRSGSFPASHPPAEGSEIKRGHIYVAPPDYHLVIARGGKHGMVRVDHGPPENRNRPSIDVLFRSAARAYGPRVIAMVLSGLLDDGAAGTALVRKHGGATLALDPDDARFSDMPRHAIVDGGAEHVVASDALASTLVELVGAAPGVAETALLGGHGP